MKKYIILILALFVIAGCTDHDMHETEDDHENIDIIQVPHAHAHHAHDEQYEVDPDNQPTIDLTIHEDPKGGWNLEITTENFVFAPERVSLDHVPGEGHVHLFFDDSKITRIYGNWYHIPESWLLPGRYEVIAILSSNDHGDYVRNGGLISASQTLVVS